MASRDITLYYFPTSHCSLKVSKSKGLGKVLLALYEKGIPFKERIMNMMANEQNENWFLRMNQKGEVPTLDLRGEYITESDVIIDVIDHTFTSGSSLVPDLETLPGYEVRGIRMMLDDIDIHIITFGVLANRKFCIGEVTVPGLSRFNRTNVDKYYDSGYYKLLKEKKSKPQELASAIDRKLELNRMRLAMILNESEVEGHLENLEAVFDKLEARLQQTKQDVEESQEYWLVGTDFTAADVSATCLMYRLSLLGVAPRYFSPNKRPNIYEYYTRLLRRQSVQKMIAVSNSTMSYVAKQTFKTYCKKALKVGVVVGFVALGYAGYKEFMKIHRGLAKA